MFLLYSYSEMLKKKKKETRKKKLQTIHWGPIKHVIFIFVYRLHVLKVFVYSIKKENNKK